MPKRKKRGSEFWSVFSRTLCVLIVAAALALSAGTVWFPVLKITDDSMSPTIQSGDVVATLRTENIQRGDIISFVYGTRMLVKRCIGLPGDVINIKEDGSVWVNGEKLDEPYVSGFSYGEADIEYPYTVPLNSYFVLGDNRDNTIDSRLEKLGTISVEQLCGKVVFRLYPFDNIGYLEKVDG